MTLCLTRTTEEEEGRVRRAVSGDNISEMNPRRLLSARRVSPLGRMSAVTFWTEVESETFDPLWMGQTAAADRLKLLLLFVCPVNVFSDQNSTAPVPRTIV